MTLAAEPFQGHFVVIDERDDDASALSGVPLGLPALADYIEYGASPRASIYLIQAARAHAFIKHRGYVIPEDIKSVGMDILRHRVLLTYEAEAEELTSEDIIRQIFERVEVP